MPLSRSCFVTGFVLFVLLGIAGCSASATPVPVSDLVSVPTTVPTVAEPLSSPTADMAAAGTPSAAPNPTVNSKTATPAIVNWTQTASVDGDFYILGNPAAPIRLVDYSDFL